MIDLRGESVNSGLDSWNGILDWATGLTFDLKFEGILYVKGTRSIATSHSLLLARIEPGGLTLYV